MVDDNMRPLTDSGIGDVGVPASFPVTVSGNTLTVTAVGNRLPHTKITKKVRAFTGIGKVTVIIFSWLDPEYQLLKFRAVCRIY